LSIKDGGGAILDGIKNFGGAGAAHSLSSWWDEVMFCPED